MGVVGTIGSLEQEGSMFLREPCGRVEINQRVKTGVRAAGDDTVIVAQVTWARGVAVGWREWDHSGDI